MDSSFIWLIGECEILQTSCCRFQEESFCRSFTSALACSALHLSIQYPRRAMQGGSNIGAGLSLFIIGKRTKEKEQEKNPKSYPPHLVHLAFLLFGHWLSRFCLM